jgi:hypothetical protein
MASDGNLMRASEPVPNNAWPNDMIISVQDAPERLVFLLFVRSAWHLDGHGVPALEHEPDVGTTAMPADVGLAEANVRWAADWDRAWAQLTEPDRRVRTPDAETQYLLDTCSDEELWAAVVTAAYGYWERGIDQDALADWQRTLFDPHPVSRGEYPERKALPALIAAWEAGLTTVLQLPFAGHFARRVSGARLVVSRLTRHDTTRYSRALRGAAS